jgi:CBS-domain-containing membrane protein
MSLLSPVPEEERMSVEKLTGEQVMTHILVTVTPDESPLMAWELMRRAGIRHLPVVDRDLLGILTRDDLAADWSGGPQQQSLRQVRDPARQPQDAARERL